MDAADSDAAANAAYYTAAAAASATDIGAAVYAYYAGTYASYSDAD